MTIEAPLTVSGLKKIKNSVIGNPSIKRQCAQDEAFVQTLVQCLNSRPVLSEPQGSKDDVRVEAAHIIASLSYVGSEDALASLLRADALRALIFALAKLQPTDSPTLKAAFARALRALAASLADIVGPSQWGLAADSSAIRDEAKTSLDYLFHIDSMDVYLPLLADSSTQTSSSIALLIGSAVRTAEHRTSVTDWLPLEDRVKETKTKRGWEKTSATSTMLHRNGGWVVRNAARLLLETNEYKYQESLMLALAALSKDNGSVSAALSKPSPEHNCNAHGSLSTSMTDAYPAALWHILCMCKSKTTEVQLAACLCAIHIIRAPLHSSIDESAARTILSVVNRMISTPSTENLQNRRKACFTLYYLVNDEMFMSQIAFARGALERLTTLLKSITPLDLNEREEDEPEAVSALREAALTAVASMAMLDNDIRRAVTDEMKLLPVIEIALAHRHIGVRYSACQCIRSISRGIAVLRTNLVDTGLGMAVFEIFKKEDEDRRVLSAALSAVCNIVNDFSPLKPVFIQRGLIPRLIQLVECGDPTLRLSAVWAIKNALSKSLYNDKKEVLALIGGARLSSLLTDPVYGVQEQSLSLLRNICTDEQSIQLIFEWITVEFLLDIIVERIRSSDEDITLQAVSLLANLANGYSDEADILLTSSNVLPALQTCLSEPRAEIRRPAVGCILQLARTSSRARAGMLELGLESTLRHMTEWNGGGLTMTHGHAEAARDEEKLIVDEARHALEILDSSKSAGIAFTSV
ncbi:ARM repeat-containing protein [Hymenopellis radicata]|nr:ARM repeat-containing protein [Hymenopellis radicata]